LSWRYDELPRGDFEQAPVHIAASEIEAAYRRSDALAKRRLYIVQAVQLPIDFVKAVLNHTFWETCRGSHVSESGRVPKSRIWKSFPSSNSAFFSSVGRSYPGRYLSCDT
jgi:hypothetical protein